YPPTPHVARRVRDRLERRPMAGLSGWRRWVGRWRGDGTESPTAGRPTARWVWSGAAVGVLAVVLVGWRLVLPSANQPSVGAMLRGAAGGAVPVDRSRVQGGARGPGGSPGRAGCYSARSERGVRRYPGRRRRAPGFRAARSRGAGRSHGGVDPRRGGGLSRRA